MKTQTVYICEFSIDGKPFLGQTVFLSRSEATEFGNCHADRQRSRGIRFNGVHKFVLEPELAKPAPFPTVARLPWPAEGSVIDQVLIEGGSAE